ncbi:hypothetical protein [Frankia sp. AgKG'84/4]|uniref:hypothetical protein n=1 Tax=Frankia sp. AgKG'84/4 TaxID=573490 RepID=UPI00200CCFEA|nr:hypothetical protein [Frankia sp. AgKG'84/4]MCL9796889.1 hypothetical protein [Frankia sp. AgKG'84/4]
MVGSVATEVVKTAEDVGRPRGDHPVERFTAAVELVSASPRGIIRVLGDPRGREDDTFVLDDPSVATTSVLPVSRALRYALRVLGVAITVGVARLRPDGSIGVVAAPVYLIVVGALYALPGRAALFVATTSAHWDEVHQVWALLLIVSTSAAFLLAREPAPRRRRGYPRVGDQTIRSEDPRVNAPL